MIYKILDDEGNVTNTISATQEYVDEYFPNHYELVGPDPVPHIPDPPPLEPEQVKSDEEKLVDLVAAAIAKLIADGVLKQA